MVRSDFTKVDDITCIGGTRPTAAMYTGNTEPAAWCPLWAGCCISGMSVRHGAGNGEVKSIPVGRRSGFSIACSSQCLRRDTVFNTCSSAAGHLPVRLSSLPNFCYGWLLAASAYS